MQYHYHQYHFLLPGNSGIALIGHPQDHAAISYIYDMCDTTIFDNKKPLSLIPLSVIYT